jgi:predicted RNase H-like HicB family nuclease
MHWLGLVQLRAIPYSARMRERGARGARLRYVVTIEREADGRFIASVPEVPGCHVYGRTRRQAVARARNALQFYVDSLRNQGRKPPKQPLVAVEVVVAA